MQSPNIIERLAGDFTLSNKNAGERARLRACGYRPYRIFVDPDNWEWKAESKAVWEPAEENWRQFHANWYGATGSQSASLVDPKSPSLSLEPLPPGLDPSISSSIFIRESYVRMFDTVWAKAMARQGRHGVIITGQPGTGAYLLSHIPYRVRSISFEGKTLFSYYLLVRLLQRKQVVLFSPDGKMVYLCYHTEIYTVSMEALAAPGVGVSLPNPISSSNVFIWSLFDIRERKEPESFLVTRPCFPVQTTSPDPIRYRTWDKERIPLLTGLPLWTRDELAQGYVLLITHFCPCLSAHYPGCNIRTSTAPCWTRFTRYIEAPLRI